MKKKKTYSAEFKTRVVLEALKEEDSLSSIASKYEISVQTLRKWKNQFLENASLAFDLSNATREYKEKIEKLEKENEELAKTLGKTTIERDWAVGKLKSLDLSNKKSLIEFKLKKISVMRQCELIGLNRSSLYYKPIPMKEEDIKIMRRIDEIYSEISIYGYRRIHKQLKEEDFKIGHNKVHRLMKLMNIKGLRPKRRKVNLNKENEIYPYLLKDLNINKPNQVWSSDITYIPVKNGYMYLCVVIDWYSKSVLAWNISNTMDTNLVLRTTQEAIEKYSAPEIFNSDQGSQYTSKKHTKFLRKNNIKISMNSKGRAIDNIVVERFFRTLKYEEIYIKEYENVKELKQGIKNFIDFYNHKRFHSSLNYDKPMSVYKKMLHKVA